MYSRGHPGKTGIGKCKLVVAAESEDVRAEAPPSPELRVPEKRSVVAALVDDLKGDALVDDLKVADLADDLKVVSINREEAGASIKGEEFELYRVGFFHWYPPISVPTRKPPNSQSWPFLVTGFTGTAAVIG